MHIGSTVTSPLGRYEVSVLIGGTRQPIYRHTGKLYVAGITGQPYTLRVRNNSGLRLELITTVDGRDVICDQAGDEVASRGYVLPCDATYEIPGWRDGGDDAYQFMFGAPTESIAARATGSAANTGVIGFAAYLEQRQHPSWLLASAAGSNTAGESILRSSVPVAAAAAPPPAMMGGGRSSSLGTGIGGRVSAPAGRTRFTRAPGRPEILAIAYDTHPALTAAGIITGSADPDPFPGHAGGYGRYAR